MARAQDIAKLVFDLGIRAIEALVKGGVPPEIQSGLMATMGLLRAVRTLLDGYSVEDAKAAIIRMSRTPIEPLDTAADDAHIDELIDRKWQDEETQK